MIFDELDSLTTTKTSIKVIGVGGAGKNAINHMIENEVRGVDFIAVNTDAQDLKIAKTAKRLLIGRTKTHGQGAGANPEIGRLAALESEDDIHEMIGNSEMVVITCGMGGGTGTGAAPVIARIAREHGCLTIAICTKPFLFEGPVRMANATAGLEEIRQYVDTLIVVPNNRLLSMLPKTTPVLAAFREADNVLRKVVQGIAEIIAVPAMINIDFADINTVMRNKGTALIGIGVASGPNREIEAARAAIHSPLLEVTIDGATDAVVFITSSQSISLDEINRAISEIRNTSGRDLNIIYGTAINNDLGDEIAITVIATGYELKAQNSGYEELADEIFRNMSDENISYEGLQVEDTTPQEDKMEEIFSTGLSEKELKRQRKLEEKRRKLEEKENRKNQKFSGSSFEDTEDKSSDSSYPDWLTRQ